MFESSDRPQQVKQSSAMRRPKQEEHPQLNASADTSESSLISSASSCSRNNSSFKPPAAPPVRSTNQTTSNPSTTSKTTDDTTSSSSSSPQAQDEDNRRSFLAIVQSQLAWQLAYYFAPANLAADTYLKTLQGLNDGCVPVNILANFGKIQTILNVTPCLRRVYAQDEAARAQVLAQAVTLNPDCGLQVVQVDANTGKVVNGQEGDNDDDKLKPEDAKAAAATDSSIRHVRTIQAIRPVPGAASTATATTTTTPAMTSDSSFTNCVLLRDVDPSVTEADIQDLLERLQPDDDGISKRSCPPVLRIQCEVANCWLISFDTTDRDTMQRVVMQLRTFTLKGDCVHARLKSSPYTPSVRPTLPSVPRAAAVTAAAIQLGIPLQKKKNRRRGKKKKKVRASGANSQAAVTGGNTNEQQDKQQLPPSLEDFPTLHDNTVEWAAPLVDGVVEESGHHPEDDDDDEEEEEEPSSKSSNKAHSDAASTATTTSSSMESVPKKALAGYAAAVLKNSNNSPVLEVGTTTTSSSVPHSPENEVDPTQSRVDTPSPAPQVVIHPPSWGRGRSFADAAKSSS